MSLLIPHAAYLHSIFVGQPKTITDERGSWTSSIYRDPVLTPVQAQKGGVVGDKVAQPYHGGPDADICRSLPFLEREVWDGATSGLCRRKLYARPDHRR